MHHHTNNNNTIMYISLSLSIYIYVYSCIHDKCMTLHAGPHGDDEARQARAA